MTYEGVLQLTEKNLKRFFPESFRREKWKSERFKNNNIKLQGYICPGSPSYTSVPLLYLESYYQELEERKRSLKMCGKNIAQDYQKCQETAITIDGISSKEWDYETIKKGVDRLCPKCTGKC